MANTNDIYGYSRTAGADKAFSNEESIITISGDASNGQSIEANAPALVQNWTLQYANRVSELTELGSSNVYWVKGRPMGTGSLARVLGFHTWDIFGKYMDICNGGATVTIDTEPKGCEGNENKQKGVKIITRGTIVEQVAFGSAVGGVNTITNNFALRFTNMEVHHN